MRKSDDVKVENEKKVVKEKLEKSNHVSEKQKKKVKELEYLLQCASAECGW